MIRKLMASCAIAALTSAGAITFAQAQTDPAQPAIEEAAPATELANSEQVLTPAQPTLASVYIGRSVFSSADPESDNIGDVNDLIVSEDGTISHAVVGVGGFLGIGEKNVAVPFDELEVVEENGDIRLIYAASREQLEAAPAIDRAAFDPTAVASTEPAPAPADQGTDALAPAPSSDMAAAPAEPATDATAPAEPATDMAAAPAEAPAVEETAPAEPATDMAAAPAEEPAAPAAETPAAEQQAATDTGTAPEAEEATQPKTDQAAVEAPATGAETTAPDQGTVMAESEAPAIEAPATIGTPGEVFVVFAADQIRASDLIGKSVYSGEDSIGEVSDIILQEDGKTRAAVIDVGGFLGAGEKTVTLPFSDLQFAPAPENADDMRVSVAMSKEQLEQLPAYEVPQETAAVEQPPAADTGMAPAEPSDQAATAPAEDTIVTGSVESKPVYEPATQELSADKLMGATVYGPDDANLGEISDLIFDKSGNIQAVLIDVGGFLGIGEKPVAVGFDSLKVRTDEGGTVFAMVDQTQDQLNQAPLYEEPAPAGTTTSQ